MSNKDPILSEEEKRFLNIVLENKNRPGPNFEEKKKKFMKVAKNTNKGKSSKKISIRLKEIDLSIIKKKAEEQGLPYQTLINSILHQRVRKRNS